MIDQRIELAGLADGARADVLAHLDGLRVVLTVAEGRGRSAEDVAGLLNVVNLGARLFPHWRLPDLQGAVADNPLFGRGTLANVLAWTVTRTRPPTAVEPTREFELCWGGTPQGEGLGIDASGWNCSLGPEHLPLNVRTGPPIGALAVGCWAVGQMLTIALKPFGVTGFQSPGFRWNLLTYALDESPTASPETAVLPPFVNAGCGSVGSSLPYAAITAAISGALADLVDPRRVHRTQPRPLPDPAGRRDRSAQSGVARHVVPRVRHRRAASSRRPRELHQRTRHDASHRSRRRER